MEQSEAYSGERVITEIETARFFNDGVISTEFLLFAFFPRSFILFPLDFIPAFLIHCSRARVLAVVESLQHSAQSIGMTVA